MRNVLIRAARKALDLSISELAENARIGRETVVRAERGDQTVTESSLTAIENALSKGEYNGRHHKCAVFHEEDELHIIVSKYNPN